MTSSGSATSAKAVKPRRSRKTTVTSRPVTLERILRTPCHDQLGEVGRKEALEAAETFELGHLLLDTLFQGPVPFRKLSRLCFEPRSLFLDRIMKALDPQHRLDPGDEGGLVYGLCQVLIATCLETPNDVLESALAVTMIIGMNGSERSALRRR